MTKTKLYVTGNIGGQWLMVREGSPDRLISEHKTEDAANRAKRRALKGAR